MLSGGMRRSCHRKLWDEMPTEGLEMRLVLGLTAVLRSCYVERGQCTSDYGEQAQVQNREYGVLLGDGKVD